MRTSVVLFVAAACGSSHKSPSDAPSDTAGDGAIDAAIDAPPDGPSATVGGTLSITDVALVDPSALAGSIGGIGGGTIRFEFDDLTDGHGGTLISGTSNINGCTVTKYDPTHPPHGQLDDGSITVSDSPIATASGLLKTVGPCTLISALGGYTCVSHASNGEAVTATTTGVPAGTVAYVFATPFTGQNLVGSYLSVNGFTTNPSFNSGAAAFPILAMANNNTALIALNPAGNATGATEVSATTQDTILNGYLPVPAQGAGDNGAADFLGAGGVRVQAAASTTWPAIDKTFDVPGEGWTLSDPGDPTALPLTGTATAALQFGCGGNTCGDTSADTFKAMVISGHATKKDLTGLAAFQMPTDVPGTDTWLEFECAFVLQQSATLDVATQQAIIDFAPTRVETRITNATVSQLANGVNKINLVVGHTYVGHTTHP